ncbi:MAG: segregation/condensation protein A [Oscillospiraceae bacterium]|nr:segregation/condensation protein A [Oscillospiraceae bacterium]
MERNPTFFMEAVIQGREDMEDFEGPLTLLLHLISRNKVTIADIQIGDICDQYIAYLDQMKEMDLDVASEFVQMASHLVYIKARAILAADEEIPELELLIHSMEDLQCKVQYTQVKGVLEALEERLIHGGIYTEKPPEALPQMDAYQYEHSVVDLLEAFCRLRSQEEIDLTEFTPRTFVMPPPITYSVTDKAEEILSRLARLTAMEVRTLFEEAKSRSEVVATFIAVLELCKIGNIALEGEGADMRVNFIPPQPGEEMEKVTDTYGTL